MLSRPVFDYNGHSVAPSKPVKVLRTVKKTFTISSADRNTNIHYTNGDFVVYLPRVYENVVCLKLKSAEFPPLIASTSPGARTHSYSNGPNVVSTSYVSDVAISAASRVYNFYIDIEGLNKSDETTIDASKSAFPDSYFSKIPNTVNSSGFIEYNSNSNEETVAYYTPAIGKLDRLHIRTRLHNQQGNVGFLYWTNDGAAAVEGNRKIAEFTLSFEIEFLENSFDDFSSFETRLGDRGHGGVGC